MDEGVNKLRMLYLHLCGESSEHLVVSLGSLKGFDCISGGKKSRKHNLSKPDPFGLQIAGLFL